MVLAGWYPVMAYSSDVAKLVSEQLTRFIALNRHQLAGQVANLDFWLAQIEHALNVLDGYITRFEKLKSGQEKYVKAHGTTAFTPGREYSEGRAPPPRRVPDSELRESRKTICESAYRLLVRCCNEDFIQEFDLRAACKRLGIGVEASDLKKRV